MNIKQEIRQKFYKEFTDSHPGDSGAGGNTPQDPIFNLMVDNPHEIADYWLAEFDTVLRGIVDRIKRSKELDSIRVDEYLPVVKRGNMDEMYDFGYKNALTAVTKIINDKINETTKTE